MDNIALRKVATSSGTYPGY